MKQSKNLLTAIFITLFTVGCIISTFLSSDVLVSILINCILGITSAIIGFVGLITIVISVAKAIVKEKKQKTNEENEVK